jgi:lysophospholipase L1-like esterase
MGRGHAAGYRAVDGRIAVSKWLLLLALACGPALGGEQAIRADDARVVRIGRTVAEADGTLRFGYAGVSLKLNFEGSRLDMDAQGGKGSLVDVIVDGGPASTVRLGPESNTVALLRAAGPGPHTVELVHRTEAWLGVVAIHGFRGDGKFLPAAPLPARRLLVLGDSVTCGANMERTEQRKDDPYWWNARLSYGMLLGRALDAQVQLVCHGGRGLVRSWNGRSGDPNLADFYKMAIDEGAQPAAWKQADYAPDLILVAIGTNDFTQGIPERAAYIEAYASFVRTLLREHGRATLVLTEGAILDGEKKAALTAYIDAAIQKVADKRVHYLPSLHHPGDALDAHPTTSQHAAMARELAPALRQLMDW